MDVVKSIERLGTSSGTPAAQVRISDCGITSPPTKAVALSPAPASSKRPAESSSANKSKKVSIEDNAAAEGINNPEKNQKKIQLTSGLEYVDIKVQPTTSFTPLLTLIEGWHRPSGNWRKENRCWLQRRAEGAGCRCILNCACILFDANAAPLTRHFQLSTVLPSHSKCRMASKSSIDQRTSIFV
jgi:hypothetical protein